MPFLGSSPRPRGTVTLKHGESGVFAVGRWTSRPEKPSQDFLRRSSASRTQCAGGPVPEGVDLPVTLLRGAARALDRHSRRPRQGPPRAL